MADNVADVLERAADLIAAPGAWTQGRFDSCERGVRCFCAAGAIFHVTTTAEREPALEALSAAVRPASIIQFNDVRGRTQAEVIAKIREAAAMARAEQVQA